MCIVSRKSRIDALASHQVDIQTDYVSKWPTKEVRFKPTLNGSYCSRSHDSDRDSLCILSE